VHRSRLVRDPLRPVSRLTWGDAPTGKGRVAKRPGEYRTTSNPEQTTPIAAMRPRQTGSCRGAAGHHPRPSRLRAVSRTRRWPSTGRAVSRAGSPGWSSGKPWDALRPGNAGPAVPLGTAGRPVGTALASSSVETQKPDPVDAQGAARPARTSPSRQSRRSCGPAPGKRCGRGFPGEGGAPATRGRPRRTRSTHLSGRISPRTSPRACFT
jgi:hypothetical protein